MLRQCVKRLPGLALVTALMPSFQTESQMAKSNQSKQVPPKTVRHSKTNARMAPKTSPVTVVAKKTAAAQPRKAGTQPTGKIETIAALLRRQDGASINDLMKATGWQAHSVRGAISAAIKKKLGLRVLSEKAGTVRLYRIAGKPAG
jgi:hypothetical protein